MENENTFEIGDKVSITFKARGRWVTLFGVVERINGNSLRVRHKASWDKSKTTSGWFNPSQLEQLPEHWTGGEMG